MPSSFPAALRSARPVTGTRSNRTPEQPRRQARPEGGIDESDASRGVCSAPSSEARRGARRGGHRPYRTSDGRWPVAGRRGGAEHGHRTAHRRPIDLPPSAAFAPVSNVRYGRCRSPRRDLHLFSQRTTVRHRRDRRGSLHLYRALLLNTVQNVAVHRYRTSDTGRVFGACDRPSIGTRIVSRWGLDLSGSDPGTTRLESSGGPVPRVRRSHAVSSPIAGSPGRHSYRASDVVAGRLVDTDPPGSRWRRERAYRRFDNR